MAVQDPRLVFYGITDQASALGRSDEAVAEALLAGGVSCLQYRAKKVAPDAQRATARALRALTRRAGVPLIINDSVALALDCGADGVHLGQDDQPLAEARRQAQAAGRGLWMGKSTHSLEQALAAQREGADYIGFGPLFATQTKENNVPPVGLEALSEVLRAVQVPVVAIGGVKLERLQAVAQAGARHCAIVTALTGAAEVAEATRAHRATWFKALGARRLLSAGA